jgi:Domain of unknown function (DUF1707)
MMAGPEDETAGAGGPGRLRASHADREQVIAMLKAAFVQGMLDRDEFGQRLGQAFTSRTHAELDTVTADLPAGLAAAQPPAPALAPGGARVLRPGRVIAAATTLYAGVWPFTFALPWPVDSEGNPPVAIIGLFFSTTLIYLLVLVMAVGFAIAGWREKRSGGQLPRRPEPGAGGPAARRLPPAGSPRQLPPAGSGHQNIAEAARSRRRRRPCAVGAFSTN